MTELGRAYGGALYALAEDEQLENELLTQLDEVCKLLADNPNYVRLIKDKAIAKAERLTLLDGAFGGRIHPYLLNFMKLLCERGAFGEMPACRAEYMSCYNNKHGIIRSKSFPQNRSAKRSLPGSRKHLNVNLVSMLSSIFRLTQRLAVVCALKWPENVMTIPLKAEWIICAAHWLQDPNLTERKPVNPWI